MSGIKLEISFPNAEVVRQGLQSLHEEIPKIGRRNIRTVLNRVVKRAQIYPSAPSGSRYVRTYEFQRKWKIVSQGDGYTMTNEAEYRGRPYGRFVMGDGDGQGQAWMHAGRWSVFRDIVNEETEKLAPEIQSEISYAARDKGF